MERRASSVERSKSADVAHRVGHGIGREMMRHVTEAKPRGEMTLRHHPRRNGAVTAIAHDEIFASAENADRHVATGVAHRAARQPGPKRGRILPPR